MLTGRWTRVDSCNRFLCPAHATHRYFSFENRYVTQELSAFPNSCVVLNSCDGFVNRIKM